MTWPVVANPGTAEAAQSAKPTDAEALRLQNARLAALHEVTLGLTSTRELPDVLQRVAEIAQTLSASAHAHIYLYNAQTDTLQRAASHWSSVERTVPLNPRRSGITYTVARTGQPVFIEDTTLHPAYAQVTAELRPGALACLPLVKDNRVLGTLSLGYWTPYRFDADKRDFLDLMARHAAIAIENARLVQMAVEKARLERDLETARQIQTSLIPRETPHLAGWDFAAFWQPAQLVGGDFYDFVPVPGSPHQGLVIADVSDKGMPAALFMAVARSTIRASINAQCCPSDCMAHANRLLYADAVNAMFVTAFYGQLDPETGELTYVNAGHNPPLVYRAAEDRLSELTRTGMALAVEDERDYGQCRLTLQSGDFMVLYTDGVTDALDHQQRPFEIHRLRQAVLNHRHDSAQQIAAGLQQSLNDHVGANPPFDDITVVVAKHV
jgi:serine phosphatase RsbU (regulator of sigma subunit)